MIAKISLNIYLIINFIGPKNFHSSKVRRPLQSHISRKSQKPHYLPKAYSIKKNQGGVKPPYSGLTPVPHSDHFYIDKNLVEFYTVSNCGYERKMVIIEKATTI